MSASNKVPMAPLIATVLLGVLAIGLGLWVRHRPVQTLRLTEGRGDINGEFLRVESSGSEGPRSAVAGSAGPVKHGPKDTAEAGAGTSDTASPHGHFDHHELAFAHGDVKSGPVASAAILLGVSSLWLSTESPTAPMRPETWLRLEGGARASLDLKGPGRSAGLAGSTFRGVEVDYDSQSADLPAAFGQAAEVRWGELSRRAQVSHDQIGVGAIVSELGDRFTLGTVSAGWSFHEKAFVSWRVDPLGDRVREFQWPEDLFPDSAPGPAQEP